MFPVLGEGASVDGVVHFVPELGGDGCTGSNVYVVWAGIRGGSGVGAHDADCFLRGERGPAVDGQGGFWGVGSVTGSSARIFREEAVVDVLDLAVEKGGEFVTEVL
ncbi:hypothetical protein NDU88_002379 [Pleurodeles waltl]|uniref:Uncharacterized protein n=1 Tax=Pleurodeles waltl TaxID=8319 RepID=A0AAV7M2A0_PLEWA|nr:hypothetical protein NDU88_002379 [Pleurodeles waltl]